VVGNQLNHKYLFQEDQKEKELKYQLLVNKEQKNIKETFEQIDKTNLVMP